MNVKKEVDLKREEKTPSEIIFREGNISMILYAYTDIFSDFDPRPYSERTLSDDFLLECKKASVDKEDVELRLLIPKLKRNFGDEAKIKRRLKNHFQKQYKEKELAKKKLRKEGLLWFFFGACLIFTATLLYSLEGFAFNLLFVMFEPAGWFTLWNGLDKIFIAPKDKQPELDFYRKMAKVRINFYGY